MDKPNLYRELQDCQWIKDKLRASDTYAQNMYAAMCNNQFQKREVLPILKDDLWTASWRAAGGKIADLRAKGEDYMDFYCSGITGVTTESTDTSNGAVAESVVTDEIRNDLLQLGWNVIPYPDDI